MWLILLPTAILENIYDLAVTEVFLNEDIGESCETTTEKNARLWQHESTNIDVWFSMYLNLLCRSLMFSFIAKVTKDVTQFFLIRNKLILANVHLTSHFVNKLYEKQIEKARTDN